MESEKIIKYQIKSTYGDILLEIDVDEKISIKFPEFVEDTMKKFENYSIVRIAIEFEENVKFIAFAIPSCNVQNTKKIIVIVKSN